MCRPYFDDIEVDQEFESSRRQITEADLILFCSLTRIAGPIFLDPDFASVTPFNANVVPGPLTVSYAIGLTGDLTQGRVLAVAAIDNVNFLAPVAIGDTIQVRTRVLEKRDSRSREGTGVVVMSHDVLNQDGKVVVHYERTLIYGTRLYLAGKGNGGSAKEDAK